MKNLLDVDPLIKFPGSKADLITPPIIIRVIDFDDDSAEDFAEDMSKAHNTGQPVIPVIIDSYGGKVYSLLSMISEIQNAKLPVATICVGKAMSCGSILLSCGDDGYRFIDSNATVMIHDVSAMQLGKNEELKASAKETDRLQKLVFRLMAKNCDQERNYFLDLIHEKNHAEWYLTAKQTKKHGIADHIHVPEFKTKISVDMTFE